MLYLNRRFSTLVLVFFLFLPDSALSDNTSIPLTPILHVLLFSSSSTEDFEPPEHPHLLFDASDVPALKQRAATAIADTNDFYADPFQEILIDCRSTYGPGKTIPNSRLRRNYQAIISHGTLLLVDPTGYAVDPNYQSSTLFFQYFNAVLDLPDWNNFFNNNPFDTTYMLQALCIGYDMHYDKFSSVERSDIVNKLTVRADYLLNHASTFFNIPANLEDPDWGYLNTFKVLRNRDKIPLSALAVIAYTLEGEVNETKRQKWLAKVNEMISIWDTYVAHDGMSHEGFSYHEFLMQSWFPMLLVRSRKEGVNQFQTLDYIRKHPLYSIFSWVPGGDRPFLQSLPFGDVDPAPPAEIRTLDALAAAMLKGDSDHRDQLANWMQFKPLDGEANNNYSRVDPTHFIWADSSIEMKSPAELQLPRFHYFPERGGFIWRSSWNNMATYFAMLCGSTIGGHQQPEMGNFIIYKGGSPFIAHHGRAKYRRTEHFNVMMFDNQGQYGDRYEDGNGTTEPQPANRWASINRLVADDDFFNVFCNMRPIYRDLSLTTYTREFLGIGDYFFVRDHIQADTSVQMDSYLHAYSTIHPTSPPGPFDVLDIDSNPDVDPWEGSGRTLTITPRTSGPFTDSMTVQDLSNTDWTGTVSDSEVLMTSDTPIHRGSKFVRTMAGNSGDSLMTFYFPQGDVVEGWPEPDQAEGFVIKRGGSDRWLTAWPNAGSFDQANGLAVDGAMGGLDVETGSLWGRDMVSLGYQGATLFNASSPLTIFATPNTSGGFRIRAHATTSVTFTLHHPNPVDSVFLDGLPLDSTQWSWSNGTLEISASASTQFVTLQTVAST